MDLRFKGKWNLRPVKTGNVSKVDAFIIDEKNTLCGIVGKLYELYVREANIEPHHVPPFLFTIPTYE